MKTTEPGSRIYWKLFVTNFVLSACTFGGGFVIISMMKSKFVEQLKWIGDDEMLDMTAIAQSAPGSLAVNMSIVVGYRLRKIPGALVSVLGTVLPPLIIISIISFIYNWFKDNAHIALLLQVMRAGVAAVIFDVVISLAQNILKTKSILWIGLMIAAFIESYFCGVSAVMIIIVCAAVGLVHILYAGRHSGKEERGE